MEWGKTSSRVFEFRKIEIVESHMTNIFTRRLTSHINAYYKEVSPPELFVYLKDMESSPQEMLHYLEKALG